MGYSEFKFEDFIMDDHFKSWVTNPDAASNEFWEEWLKENPDKKDVLDDARKFILNLNFKNYFPSYDIYLKEWDRLSHSIDQADVEKGSEDTTVTRILDERIKTGLKEKTFKINYLGKIAASVAFAAIVGLAYFLVVQSSKIVVVTGIGETKKVVLPDHSVVTINANSKLIYSKNLGEEDIREVWLKGEGFFEVAKRSAGQKFQVIGSHMTVEVLGTKFNFSDREEMARIVLNEGKVKLNIDDDKQNEIYMKPGELVEYAASSQNIQIEKVKPELYNSWKENLLIFEQTPLKEIGAILENNFGYKVEFSDSSMKHKRMVGTFPADQPEELLWNLKKIYGAKVIKEKKYILF